MPSMALGIDGTGAVTSTGAAVELLDSLEGKAVPVSGFDVAFLAMICTTVSAASCSGELNSGSSASLSCPEI